MPPNCWPLVFSSLHAVSSGLPTLVVHQRKWTEQIGSLVAVTWSRYLTQYRADIRFQYRIESGLCNSGFPPASLYFIKSWDKLEFVGRAIFAFCLNTKKYRCISEKCSQLFVSSSPTVPDSNSDWSALITGSQEKTYIVFMYWSQSCVSLMTVSNIHYVDEPSKV